jgi:hypothetical protein
MLWPCMEHTPSTCKSTRVGEMRSMMQQLKLQLHCSSSGSFCIGLSRRVAISWTTSSGTSSSQKSQWCCDCTAVHLPKCTFRDKQRMRPNALLTCFSGIRILQWGVACQVAVADVAIKTICCCACCCRRLLSRRAVAQQQRHGRHPQQDQPHLQVSKAITLSDMPHSFKPASHSQTSHT